MKKTVQIVTIPLNKSGKLAKKDTSDKYELAEGETVFVNGFGYTPQQLLVLSNDGIFPKDNLYGDGKLVVANNEWSGETNIEWKKVIASYPHIEGTLPMSKETVQAWIDSGTPEEGSVGFITNTKNHTEKYSVYFPDPQGNLLLEFGEKDSLKNIMSTGYKWETIEEFADSFKPSKASIPTDEEIERKAHNNYTYGYLMSIGSRDRSIYEEKKESYTSGYKQALKDLGYE
jgi:hypothetical protein